MKLLLITAVAAVFLNALSRGAEGPVIAKPSQKDKCPVCGMFVAKYPDWVAVVVMLKDATQRSFTAPRICSSSCWT